MEQGPAPRGDFEVGFDQSGPFHGGRRGAPRGHRTGTASQEEKQGEGQQEKGGSEHDPSVRNIRAIGAPNAGASISRPDLEAGQRISCNESPAQPHRSPETVARHMALNPPSPIARCRKSPQSSSAKPSFTPLEGDTVGNVSYTRTVPLESLPSSPMKHLFAILSLLALSSLPCRAAVSGTITDLFGRGLSDVGVSLALAGTSTTSDSTGAWTLDGNGVGIPFRLSGPRHARWTGTSLVVTLAEPSTVSVDAYDLKGALQGRLATATLGAGSHSLPLAIPGSGMVWLRVTLNGKTERLASPVRTHRGTSPQGIMATRSQGIVDTLRFTWRSKVVARIPLTTLDTSRIVARVDTATGIGWNDTITYGSLHDSRDGQVYRTVKIGTQTWMAQNLNYKPTGADSSWCFTDDSTYCLTYGRLYTWSAVMAGAASSNKSPSGVQGICPTGWHVPSDPEWTSLQGAVDPLNGADGTRLKSRRGWRSYAALDSGNGTDIYGFRALPGGYIVTGTAFLYLGNFGYWWSATADDILGFDAWARGMEDYRTNVKRSTSNKSMGFSLRCTKN